MEHAPPIVFVVFDEVRPESATHRSRAGGWPSGRRHHHRNDRRSPVLVGGVRRGRRHGSHPQANVPRVRRPISLPVRPVQVSPTMSQSACKRTSLSLGVAGIPYPLAQILPPAAARRSYQRRATDGRPAPLGEPRTSLCSLGLGADGASPMALRARPCRIAAARRSRSSARRLARGLALPRTPAGVLRGAPPAQRPTGSRMRPSPPTSPSSTTRGEPPGKRLDDGGRSGPPGDRGRGQARAFGRRTWCRPRHRGRGGEDAVASAARSPSRAGARRPPT